MLDYIIERTNEFLAGFSKAVRKKKGQFFTSPETARFMSGMFDLSGCGDSVSILDPGAGSGILSAALIERLLSEKPGLFISLVCYETDPDILPLLKDNLEHMKQESEGRLEYELKAEDYILSQDWDFNSNADTSRKFDFIISNPNYRYRLTEEALRVIRSLNSREANNELEMFLAKHETLKSIYSSKKNMALMPVHFDGSVFNFSPGKHNELQKAILEEFAPLFAGYSECLYVGDSTDRDLVNNVFKMEQLGFNINVHNKMPDIVLYRADKDWIYFIEAVTSVGHITPKRRLEIIKMTENVKSGKIFVTAFPDFDTFIRFARDLAWETEVWLANNPKHMIHLNGNKFIGPQ